MTVYVVHVSHFGYDKKKSKETHKTPVIARPFVSFSTAKKAREYVKKRNSSRRSEYSSKYSYRKVVPK